MSLRWRVLVVAVHLGALWPTLRWWGARLTDGSDEVWGLAAWPIALWIVRRQVSSTAPRSLLPAALGLFLYATTQGLLPPLLSAIVGVTSLSASLSASFLGRALSWPLCLALLLGLPIEASLQFYLGYPLRFVVAAIAAPMLGTLGFDVVALGTQLSWASLEVAVDGPCSGIRMLRMGILFSCLLSLRQPPSFGRFALNLALTMGALVFVNAVRATSLFVIALTEPPWPWLHAGVGVVAFALLLVSQYLTHVAATMPRPALARAVP